MVDRNYISADDVFGLFAGPIVQALMSFNGHIEDLAKETGVPDGLYEHARNLGRHSLAS